MEERTRKIGEEDEIEEKNREGRKVEMNKDDCVCSVASCRGFVVTKDGFKRG